jgi:Lon-like ATP-dependent protease
VEAERLSAHVEHLQDGPYDRKDDVLKATAQEVVQTMRDLMNLNPLYKEAAALFFQQVGPGS